MTEFADRQVIDKTIYRGDTLTIPVTVTDIDGEPVDLTTWTARGQVRVSANATNVLAEMQVNVVDAALGELEYILSSLQTANIELVNGEAHWDGQVASNAATPEVFTPAYGTLSEQDDITRA